jgi:hypothetical protein
MISPFYDSDAFILYLEPILNPYLQSYQNIITLDRMPKGVLEDMVSTVNLPKLSGFQQAGPNIVRTLLGSCVYILLRYPKGSANGVLNWKCPDIFMGADDIPAVFAYLKKNGYSVDTDLTKMMFNGPVTIGGHSDTRYSGDRKMICMITKN